MTTSSGVRIESKLAIFVLAAVLISGFVISQPALATNNGNNGNGNGNLSANDQSVSVDENSSITITLTGSGPSGFKYVISSGPMHGTLTGIAPNLTYTPEIDYFGTDSFTFHTHKRGNDSTDAVVSITINEVTVELPPVLTCNEGFHAEGESCVADVVEEEVQPPVLTCNEGFHLEGEVCVVNEEANEEGDSEGTDNDQQLTTSSNGDGKNRSLVRKAAMSLMDMHGSIPESTTGLGLYEAIIGPTGINLLSAMKAVTVADMDWTSLTEGQQVWMLENFNALLN